MSPVKKKTEGTPLRCSSPVKRKATRPLSRSPAKKANAEVRRSPRRQNTSTPIPQSFTEPPKGKSRKKLDHDLTISSPETSLSPPPSPIRSRTQKKNLNQNLRRPVVVSSSESSPEPPPRHKSPPVISSPERSRVITSLEENWAVFTLYHPTLLKDFDEQTAKGGGNVHSVAATLIELVGKTKPLPTSVQLGASKSHPAIFYITEKSWDAVGGLALKGFRYIAPITERVEPLVKLNFKGLLGECLNHYIANLRNILLIYGKRFKSTEKSFEIDPQKETRKIYCFTLNTKDRVPQSEEAYGIPQVFNNQKVVTVEAPVQPSVVDPNTDPLILMKDYVSHLLSLPTLVITYPKIFNFYRKRGEPTRWEGREVIGQRSRSSSVDSSLSVATVLRGSNNVENEPRDVELNQQDNNRPSTSASQKEARSYHINDIHIDAPTTSVKLIGSVRLGDANNGQPVPIVREPHPSRPPSPESHPPNIDETGKIQYADFIEANWFVKGESRPSLLKIKGRQYGYRTLQAIDDVLQKEIVQQSRHGTKPIMMASEEQFIHAMVVNVLPPKYGNPNYRLIISDETKENVMLRICASKLESAQGPDIKKGDVIRVHRVKAQVEYTILTGCHEMVLSTTPHRNYAIFSLKPGKIVCDTLARTFSYNEEFDVARIKALFQLKQQKDREEQERLDQYLLDEWDGNTSIRNNNQEEGFVAQNESLNSMAAQPLATTTTVAVISTPRRERHYSPKFHVPAPDFPI